jgi:hypothetical protein
MLSHFVKYFKFFCFFFFFLILFDANAQIKYSKRRSSRSQPQHSSCEYIGISKNQRVKFSKYLKKNNDKKHLTDKKKSSKPKKTSSSAPDKTSSALTSTGTASTSVISASGAGGKTSTKIEADVVLGSGMAGVRTAAGKKDSIKALDEKAEALWYTTAKPVPPKNEKMFFSGDEDELSPLETEMLKVAEKNIRYGYNVFLVEYIPKSDFDAGKNVTFMRLNKIKSQLLKLGADPDKVYIRECPESERPLGEKYIQIEIKD